MQTINVVNCVKGAISQVVPISQTNQVVSNVLTLTPHDQLAIAFEVTATSVTGTGGIVKLQHSMDGVNFTDVDATNAKITVASATRFPLSLSAYNATVEAKFPLWPFIRFVATTTGSDAFTVTKILVTSARP